MNLIRVHYQTIEKKLSLTIDFEDLQSLCLLKDFEKAILIGQYNTRIERVDTIIDYKGSFKARITYELIHACDFVEGLKLMQSVSKELIKLEELNKLRR